MGTGEGERGGHRAGQRKRGRRRSRGAGRASVDRAFYAEGVVGGRANGHAAASTMDTQARAIILDARTDLGRRLGVLVDVTQALRAASITGAGARRRRGRRGRGYGLDVGIAAVETQDSEGSSPA